MAFNDTIIGGGGELIREVIRSRGYVPGVAGWQIARDGSADFAGVLIRGEAQSPNYDPDREDGAIGWRIAADGSAFFANVSIGGAGYAIDNDGGAAFLDVSVDESFSYQGMLFDDILWNLPKGIIAWGSLVNLSVSANSSTEVMFEELDAELQDGRIYRIATTNLVITGTALDNIATIRVRDGGAGSPTTSSGLLLRANVAIRSTSALQSDVRVEHVFTCDSSRPEADRINLHPGMHRFALSLARVGAAGTVSIDADYPKTIYVEDCGPLLDNTGQRIPTPGGGGTPVVKTYTKTYNATWSRFWDHGGGSVNTTNGELAQGQYSSAFGNRIAWVGFDSAQIRSDLTGATVKKVEFYLYYWHWYNSAGGTAIIGTHRSTASSAPAYNGSLDNQDRKRVSKWAINSGKWVEMPLAIGNELKAGTTTGIVIGQGPSTSHEYYGKARGYGQSGAPKIRITYTK